MARRLSKQEKDVIAEKLKELTSGLTEPTTATQLAKHFDCGPEVIEPITISYNIPNVIHGREALLLNKRIAFNISYAIKLDKLRSAFEDLYAQGLDLIQIRDEMKGLNSKYSISFERLCSHLGYDWAPYEQMLKEKRLAEKEEEIRDRWISRINGFISQLKEEGVPITVKQILRKQYGSNLTADIIMKYSSYLSAPLILGSEADEIDKQLTSERHRKASKANAARMIELVRETSRKKYGKDSYFQTAEFQEKSKKTRLERYGDPNYTNREKASQTLLEQYGVVNVQQIPEVKQKALSTWNERYGRDNKEGHAEWQRRIREGTLEKYGVEYPCLTPECVHRNRVDYLYKGIIFQSSYELCYYIWAAESGHNIERYQGGGIPYQSQGQQHKYFPDFVVDGKLVEIKGVHLLDEEGMLTNPFTSDQSMKQVMHDKHVMMNELNIEMIVDCDPYLSYVKEHYSVDFPFLFRKDIPFPYMTATPKKSNNKDLIRYFHPSIYRSRVGHHLTPVEAWNDKDLVLQSALNRLKYAGRCKPADVVSGFNIAKIAPKVSVFSAKFAQDLIDRYLYDANVIFDPFSGFSGRLLGAYRQRKKYIGRDLSEEHVQESNNLIQFLGIQDCCSVNCQDILKSSGESFDCLFTCPPYHLKETWGQPIEDKSCDEWIDECLNRFNCRKYLFVVDDTTKYVSNVVDVRVNKSHFGENEEKIVLINRTAEVVEA